MSAALVNFGCRLNLAEGEAMRAGLADGDVLVNSCAVTAEAERQARQAIRRAARGGARVVASGCAVRLAPELWAAMPGVAAILPARPDRPAVSGDGHARAFVEAQNGCDHDCTFCVTVKARGPARSHSPDAIVDAIRGAVVRGQREAVLTGVDLASYTGGLAALVARILRDVPELPRLRLSSLDPAAVDPALFALIADEPRVMPHVHLSLQSGDNLILKRMKRRHSRGTAVDLARRLKAARPEIAIGADLIAGFPTESAEAHAHSLSIVDEADIVMTHVFPYSPRPGTAAARMPQVAPEAARARAAELRSRGNARRAGWLSGLIGTGQAVLVERDGLSGHAPNFARVTLPGSPAGTIVEARIVASDGARLTGTLA